jgi:alpha-glucosidase
MADFGYDVSNDTDIDPIFGNLEDIRLLVKEAHKRSIKVIFDFVPNHSSDEHPWFIDSKSSISSSKRNWYTWRDAGPDGSPPNNWLSVFGGSAWEYDKQTDQYYLHSFLAKQPDLNWDNKDVREAMKSAMRFWLDLGIDGFRVDAVDWMSKDTLLRDDPVNVNDPNAKPGFDHNSLKHSYSRDGPHLFDRLNEMTTVLEEYEDRFMITEAHPETDDKVAGYLNYYQGINPHLSAPFNFEGIYLPWTATNFGTFIEKFQKTMLPGYIPIYTTGNHDESRIRSRIGAPGALVAAVMLLTLPGMAFIYYGEELGMSDVDIPKAKIQDPFAGKQNGRDPQRTPMQWDTTLHAGFTTVLPWLPVSDDYEQVNVESESEDPESSLNLYKRLLSYRNQSEVLRLGNYAAIELHDDILGYKRTYNGKAIIVLLNFSHKAQIIENKRIRGAIVLSTHRNAEGTLVKGKLALQPNEGLVIELQDD